MKSKIKKLTLTMPYLPRIAANVGFGGPRFRALNALPKNAVGAEIGVHLGDFSHCILDIARPKRLHLIDPWKLFDDEKYSESWYGNKITQETMDLRHQSVCNRFSNAIAKGQVEVIRKLSSDGLKAFGEASLDFVYIDGDHSYEGTKSDLELSLAKLKVGGLVTGDDYGPGSWWEGGVKRAVDEFGWNESVKLLWIEETQFVLKKIK